MAAGARTLRHRDLSGRRFVYLWAEGVYFTPRLDRDRQCILVVIGADADGNPHLRFRRELLAIEDGYPESTPALQGLLTIHGRSGSGCCSQPDLTGEPLVATLS